MAEEKQQRAPLDASLAKAWGTAMMADETNAAQDQALAGAAPWGSAASASLRGTQEFPVPGTDGLGGWWGEGQSAWAIWQQQQYLAAASQWANASGEMQHWAETWGDAHWSSQFASGEGGGVSSGNANSSSTAAHIARESIGNNNTVARRDMEASAEQAPGELSHQGPPEDEGEAYADHLASAVQSFLAGVDVDESGSESGEDGGTGKDTTARNVGESESSSVRAPLAADGSTASSGAAIWSGQPWAAWEVGVASGGAPGLESPAEAWGAQRSAAAPPQSVRPMVGLSEPSQECVQDFLNVLRRRNLPVAMTELPGRLVQVQGELAAALQSLYRDRLWPAQNILARRLRECGWDGLLIPGLLPLSAREPETYKILPPIDREQPVVLFQQEPEWFEGWIDTEAPETSERYYPQKVWDALILFLSDEHHTLPCDPYHAAMVLQRSGPPALRLLCVGELEHVVRLGYGKRRLVTHRSGVMQLIPSAHIFEEQRRIRSAALHGTIAQQQTWQQPQQLHEHKQLKMPECSLHAESGAWQQAGPTEPQSDSLEANDIRVVLHGLMKEFTDGAPLRLIKQRLQAAAAEPGSEGLSFAALGPQLVALAAEQMPFVSESTTKTSKQAAHSMPKGMVGKFPPVGSTYWGH